MSKHLEAIRIARTKLVRAEHDLLGAVLYAEAERARNYDRTNMNPELTKGAIAEAAGVSRQTLDAMLRRGKAA